MSYSADFIAIQIYYSFIVVILLGHIRQKFVAFCFKRSLPQGHYSLLQTIKIARLSKRMYRLDALFLVQIQFCTKFCPYVLETAVFEFLFGISETFLFSASAVQVNIAILLVAL
jgi:hypothetical protein